MLRFLPSVCYVAGIGTVLGVITNEQILTWSAVVVAVSSTLVTAMIAGLHKIREAARQEDIADRAGEAEDIRAAARLHIELEGRVASNESRVLGIDDAIVAIKIRAAEISGRISDAEKRSAAIIAMLDRLKNRCPLLEGSMVCAGDPPEGKCPLPNATMKCPGVLSCPLLDAAKRHPGTIDEDRAEHRGITP